MAVGENTKMIWQSMIALGLVAALAWNDAIKGTIELVMNDDESMRWCGRQLPPPPCGAHAAQ